MIRIGLKGLAKYILATPANQRKILTDHKFPYPEGEAQAQYYRDVRRLVKVYHQNNNRSGFLLAKAEELRSLAQIHGGASGLRLRHNVRALREYERCWGDKQFQVLGSISLAFHSHGVRISVFPDLHVSENGMEKIVKFEFSSDDPDPQLLKIMSQIMFEAAIEGGLLLQPAGVLILDVPRGNVHRVARVRSRIKRDIEAACETIANVWPALEPPVGGKQKAS
jgi:hypothetical protein